MQKVTQLRSGKPPIQPIVHINTFGAFLRYLREREQITQSELVSTFSYFFEEEYGIAPLTPDMYRKMEKGKRAPQYKELLPLYAALVGNDFKVSPQERSTFVRLARLKIEGLQRKRPKLLAEGEWRLLEIQLAQLDQKGTQPTREIEDKEQTTGKRARQKISLDTSHIVGREPWLARMLSYLDTIPKKLVVIQGMMGIGKTSGIKLLLQNLLEREECWPVLYSFPTTADITPSDHLNTFLATILAELQVSEPEASKTPPLAKRIEQVIKHLAETEQRIILLIDDAQVIIDERSQLPREWQQFFAEYLSSNHQALIYLATREWPLWTGRDGSFVVNGDEAVLPPLDQQAGTEVWRRLGFADVPENLLQEATVRCGGNALVIELRAASLQRPRFSFDWLEDEPDQQKSEHQRLIEQLLKDAHIFGSADVEARKLLQQAIGRRLSYDALQILEALAATSLALPFPLLLEINQEAEYALVELLQTSLIDRNIMKRDKRAVLQPLAREAVIHQLLADKRLASVEQQLIRAYTVWLERGTFLSEQEQATLISELVATHLKQHHLLEAAELLIEYGWLSFAFGHAPRLARIADEIMRSFNWHHSTEEEVGGLLIQYDLLARALDKDLGNAERKKAYLHLYEIMITEKVAFRPRTIVYLVHHKLRYLIGAKQYAEAWTLIDEACRRYEDLQYTKPITYAELLDRRAYVLGRWGDHQDAQSRKELDKTSAKKLQEEAHHYWQEAVEVHQQCIDMLRRSERFSSPVEQSHIRFKRARLLNDLAYYRRCIGLLEEAKQAMGECLKLKEVGFAWTNSLAVSYGDYGQLLGQLGHYQDAVAYADHALQIVQKIIDDGDTSAMQEKGMQLVDKGKLLLLLGHLDEAKALFKEGIELVEGTSRSVYKDHAEEGLQLIEAWHRENPRHQLDWRWYLRYHQLVSYDDITWLTQAGPFTEAERQEWEKLIEQREDAGVAKRMSAIVVQSRKREVALSLEEQREPRFHYPLIPYEEVQSRLAGLSLLRAEIEQHEPNIIVRRLYLDAIDERLDELKLVDATYRGNDEDFWLYSQRLAEKTTLLEMQIALSQLLHRVEQGSKYTHTQELSNSILQKLQQWHLMPLVHDFEASGCEHRAMVSTDQPLSTADPVRQMFPDHVVQSFFEEVFKNYQFNWTVVIDSAATSERVDLNRRRLILTDKPMSSTKIRELLAHEIEIHVFRSSSGARSSLAILSSGLQGYLDTEEGLATFYTAEATRQGSGIEPKPKLWIGTLACGLASGVACSPLSFRELFPFVESVSLLVDLLDRREVPLTQLQEKAQRYAENRCLRTYRGVTHLERRGICSNKDTYYLRGFLKACRELERDPGLFDQLMVGSLGLHHLADLGELGITKSGVVHKHLATDPELDNYIITKFAHQDPS
jgi:transcriptional regulator with XRE-family HTH domain